MAYTNSYGIRGCFDGLHTPDCGSPQIDRAREEEHRLKMDALRAREQEALRRQREAAEKLDFLEKERKAREASRGGANRDPDE